MSDERNLKKISILEKELRTRDEELKLAALYGKQLLQDREQLKIQIEALKQENYSLQLKLEAKLKSSESQLFELECQKDTINENESEIQFFKKEHHIMNKKLQEKIIEVEEVKKTNDELLAANNLYKEKIFLLEGEIKSYQEQVQVSLNETNSEEYQKVVSELQKCQEEKMMLLSRFSDTELKLDKIKSQEEKYISLIESLKQGLEERDYEIQSYSSMVQKAREENSELLGQIEMLKLEQMDINRKGNSVFSEVEDRRKLVERELIVLRKKHEAMQENYNIRLTELRKVKHQMSIFLGMFSQKVDYNYLEDVENSLRVAKKEIEYMTKRLDEQIRSQDACAINPAMENTVQPDDQYGYLRALLSQSQKKNEELERELQNQRMLKLAESDELIQTKQLLYRSQKNVDNLKGEVLQLKLKLQDVLMKPGDEKTEVEVKKETVPGFVKLLEQRNGSLNSCSKIREIKSCKKTLPHNKENQEIFEALKNSISTKKLTTVRKQIFPFAEDGDADGSLTGTIQTPFKQTEKLAAPVLVMNNGKDGCAQQ